MSNLLWDALTHSEEGEGRGSRLVSALACFGLAAACGMVGWWLLSGFNAGVEDMDALGVSRTRQGRSIGFLGFLGFGAVGIGGVLALLGVVLGLTFVLPRRPR